MALRDVGRPEMADHIVQRLFRLTENANPTDPDYFKRAAICMQSVALIATKMDEHGQTAEAVEILARIRNHFSLSWKLYDSDMNLTRARFAIDLYLQSYLMKLSKHQEADELNQEISYINRLISQN